MEKKSYLSLTREGEVIKISGNSSAVSDSGRSFPIHNSDFEVEARCHSSEDAIKALDKINEELGDGKGSKDVANSSLRVQARYVKRDEIINILSGIGAQMACPV